MVERSTMNILAVNTTSTSDGGTYTCQVTTTGGQNHSGTFQLTVNGMPHNYHGEIIMNCTKNCELNDSFD